MPLQDKLNIAVFVDYDNIEIGLKTTLRREFDVGLSLDALKERGDIVAKFAYANWGRQEGAARQMAENAVQMVQRLPSPRGDKNGGDINLALDALEMAFTHAHVNAFAIISGDSDFIPLVNKLKEYGKTVYVVGGKAFTSTILQSNCHEFIAYENLLLEKAARLDGQENGPHMEKLKQEMTDVIYRSEQRNDRWGDRRDRRDRGDRGDRGSRGERGDRGDRGDRAERAPVEAAPVAAAVEGGEFRTDSLPNEIRSLPNEVRAVDRGLAPRADVAPRDERPRDFAPRDGGMRDGAPREGGEVREGREGGRRRESWTERRERRREERMGRRGDGRPDDRGDRASAPPSSSEPRVTQEVSAALPLVERSLQTLERRGVQAQLGLLKSTMMQLDPTFHERGFGASSFSDFIDRLKKAELIDVQGTGGKLTIERKGGANAKPLPEPEEALPLLRDALEAHRYEMEMGDGIEPGELLQWMHEEHSGFDAKNYGFPGINEFLNYSQDKGVVRLQMSAERGLIVYLGREFFPPPAPKEEKEEDFYSEYDEIQPYVEGQPSLVEPNPPPAKPKKTATRARKAPAKKSSSAAKPASSSTGRTRKRKTD